MTTWRGFHVSWGSTAKWLLAAFVLVMVSDGILYLLDRPFPTEFMERIYRTAAFKPLLFLVICIVGPVYEEIFFRGFLFTGFEKSKLGAMGTDVVTALLWTALHSSQYAPVELTVVFILGLFLGFARSSSASVLPCIAIHVLNNITAFVGVAFLGGAGNQ